jgi:hypothetical protein
VGINLPVAPGVADIVQLEYQPLLLDISEPLPFADVGEMPIPDLFDMPQLSAELPLELELGLALELAAGADALEELPGEEPSEDELDGIVIGELSALS